MTRIRFRGSTTDQNIAEWYQSLAYLRMATTCSTRFEPDEIQLAIAAVRKDRQLTDSVRFVTVATLNQAIQRGRSSCETGEAPAREGVS